MFRTISGGLPLVALLACSKPYPPTVTAAELAAYEANRAEFETFQPIVETALPTGTVQYAGQFSGDIYINGSNDYGMVGDMTMGVNFAGGPGSVDGRLRNINLIENGTPDQRMGGSMRLNGQVEDGTIDARATGNLSFVGNILPIRWDADIALTFDGTVVDPGDGTSAVSGTVSGTSSVRNGNQVAFRDGYFYGSETP